MHESDAGPAAIGRVVHSVHEPHGARAVARRAWQSRYGWAASSVPGVAASRSLRSGVVKRMK